MTWSVASGSDAVSLQTDADGGATVTGVAEGAAILEAVSVSDPQTVLYCTVQVADRRNQQLGAFMEEGGEVLIDLTAAMEQSAYAGFRDSASHYWRLNEDGNAMTVQPDFGLQWAASTTADTADSGSEYLNKYAPELTFQINFQTAGTYYIHTLSSHPIDDSDSYHVGLDGQWQCHTNYATHEGAMRWEKSESRWKIVVSEPGVHTLNIWPREDGIVSHRIYLTTQAGASYFDGWGPEASQRELVDVGDKSGLERLAASHADKTQAGYTPASWAPFAEAFTSAVKLLGDSYASAEALDAAEEALETAAAALVEAEPPAGLADISLGDYPLPGFASGQTEYAVTLPAGVTLPVTAAAGDPADTLAVEQTEDSAVITLTSPSGGVMTYTLRFIYLDDPAALAVFNQIEALPDQVEEADRPAVEAARAAYEALDDAGKGAILNLSRLQAAEGQLPGILKGDLNGDNQVDIQDVMAACKILARKNSQMVPTPDEIARGDMTGDGDVTIEDIMAICKVLARQN